MNAIIGFRDMSPVVYRVYNVLLATSLLIVLSPLILILVVILFVTQGPKIFYCGPRVGMNGRTFQIIKFRTLCPHAARALTADRTLPADSNIETPLGKLLREVRLDELPQLLNIIRGDMNLCGPRPVRPQIADIESRRIKGYERRFEVRPGLIGPAQACFGHGASKKIRARMNALALSRPVSISAELMLLGRIGYSILERLGSKLAGLARRSAQSHRHKSIHLVGSGRDMPLFVQNIDYSSLTARSVTMSPQDCLAIRLRSGAVRRARVELAPSGKPGIFNYKPVNEVDAFIIERYALGKVIIPPRIATTIEMVQPIMGTQEAGA
ncbi:sugar transferase [Paracoccus jeotgali]|uniref:sugar transferase n=1 Tax=Paracoccus jeotgali TaxID=2065379 RepID=UPI0028A779A3|nr:sugar transferase [Paracoccus jeotgali]